MKILQSGEHFGNRRKTLELNGCILTEAGYTSEAVPWHYHENAYFYYHLKGRLTEVNKKAKFSCRPGTVLFHYWQDPHYDIMQTEDVRFFHLEFRKAWFLKFDVDIRKMEGSRILANPLFDSLFREIYRESRISDQSTELAVHGLLLQAFAVMGRQQQDTVREVPSWVRKLRDQLQDCSEEKITLADIAKETNLHPVYLSRQFPVYFRMGFGQYLRKLRLEKAAGLLARSDRSLTEIAYACGFSDQSHFIRLFRKAYGYAPLQYRKLMRRN